MTTHNDKIKFAVAGCGHIGKRHAEMILRNPEAELVGMSDILPREDLGLDGYDVPFFQSVEDMVANVGNFDVLCVCTPNGLHAEHSLLALNARKHVVCEKPMALSKAECEKIIFKALNVSRQVFCVMQNRYSPPSQWLKEIITDNVLGDIFVVQVNCYWNRDDRYYKPGNWKGNKKLDGGTLFTQFAHFVDLLYWLFGDIDDIQAKFSNFNHQHSIDFEDSGCVSFKFVNGGMGSINYSSSVWDKNLESSMTIIGRNGSVKVGGQYMNQVEYCHVKDYTMPVLAESNPANDYGAYKGSAANHHYVIENVIDTLKGGTSINTNALEGLKVVEMIERIYALRK